MNDIPNRARSRRRFIIGSGSLVALGPTAMRTSASSHQAQTLEIALTGWVIYREKDRGAEVFARVMQESGMQALALEADVVRQWRSLMSAGYGPGDMLSGLTDWSDFQLVRGLAAEQGRRLIHVRAHKRRPVQNRDRALQVALELLAEFDGYAKTGQLPTDSRKNDNGLSGHDSALFSWVIV